MMKIAVIGCGSWGQNIIRNFAELGVLAGVCDLDMDKARLQADRHQTFALSLNDILTDSTIDGVAIVTHAYTHFEIAKDCLNAGKHVFVEKPLTMHSGEAFQLEVLAKKNRRVLMVGHLLRYHPAFIQLLKIVQEDRLGTIRRIISNRLNAGRIRHQETVLWDLAPHDLSMVMALAKSTPKSIQAQASALPESKIMEAASCQIQFHNGIEATINVSWVNPTKEHKLVIIGDKGMAIFDDTQDWGHKVQFFDHITNDSSTHAELIPGKAQSIIVQVQEPLRQECQHFLDCIQQQMMPITHATDASQVVAIIEACHESIEENCSLVYGTSSQDSLLTDHQGRQESKDEPTYGVVLH